MKPWLLYALWVALSLVALQYEHPYEPTRAWCLSDYYAHIELDACAPMRELLEVMRIHP